MALEIALEKVVGTQFHVQHGLKTTPLFLAVDRITSWLLLPIFISLLSGRTENTNSCIPKVTDQV